MLLFITVLCVGVLCTGLALAIYYSDELGGKWKTNEQGNTVFVVRSKFFN